MKQKIVDRFESWEEKASISGRRYSWSKTKIEHVLLECGHMMLYRSMRGGPKHTVDCKKCSQNVDKAIAIRDTLAFKNAKPTAQSLDPEVKDPIARALFDNFGAKDSEPPE